ncbi:MAG TPA: TolC family protein [Gemmatimonadaceae bacterium]|nr:TolC family protein [Gemmatimonadaceae bacterium]
MRRFALLLLCGAASLGAQQAPQTLTLQDAIALAQKQGPQAQIARSQRDAARYRNDSFNAGLLPQVRLAGDAANLNHGINPVTLPDGSTEFIGQAQNQSTLGLAIDQRVPLTGGTLTLGSQMSRIDLFGDHTNRYYQTTPFYIALQQDLFKPRTLVWNEKEQSLGATVAEHAYLEAREDVAANVAGAFFDLYAAEVSLRNATANQAVNDTLYTLNKGRYEVGKIGENDLLKSELQLLRARASVDDSKLQRDRAEAALRRQLVVPDGQRFTIAVPDSIPNVAVDPDLAVSEALRNASAMQQNTLDETFAKQEITTAKLNNRFNATLQASVGFNQTANAFGQAYQSPLGKQALQLGVNMPMMQWGAGHAQVEAAKADMQRIQSNNKSRRDQLVEDARFSALQLQQAQRNVVLAAKADTVSAKQFEVARNRYTIGKISNTDLYNAQNDKDQAVLSYVQALRSYWTSYYHLRRATLYDFATKSELADVRDTNK